MFELGGIFKIERLSGLEWLISILIGLGQLPLCLLSKLITRCAQPTAPCSGACEAGVGWGAAAAPPLYTLHVHCQLHGS